ncbi:MAG: GAF domain-containing protein [Salinivirgaceae bacterium]
MVNYLDIVQGGLFILNEADEEMYLELKAAVAFDREKMLNKKFRIGEGLVGRCAYEKLPIYLTEIPENYVTITSGLGTGNPRSIALIPALMENKVMGVIELVSFKKFEPFQLEFIAKVGENLASSISMVRINEKTQKLLEESQVQKDELAAQEEEMRQNLEELQATQEEMKRKELELTQINEDLLTKIKQLEIKNNN